MQAEKKPDFYVAKTISYLFHPMLMPTLGVIIINAFFAEQLRLTDDGERAVVIITLISTLILPLAFIPFMLYQKLITSIELKKRRERIAPMLITSVFYFFAYYIMYKVQAPYIYKVFMLSVAVSVFTAFVISTFYKISNHMIGIGGIVGFAWSLMYFTDTNVQLVFFAAIFMAGLTAYSRLRQNAHHSHQVYAGFLLGAGINILIFYLNAKELVFSL